MNLKKFFTEKRKRERKSTQWVYRFLFIFFFLQVVSFTFSSFVIELMIGHLTYTKWKETTNFVFYFFFFFFLSSLWRVSIYYPWNEIAGNKTWTHTHIYVVCVCLTDHIQLLPFPFGHGFCVSVMHIKSIPENNQPSHSEMMIGLRLKFHFADRSFQWNFCFFFYFGPKQFWFLFVWFVLDAAKNAKIQRNAWWREKKKKNKKELPPNIVFYSLFCNQCYYDVWNCFLCRHAMVVFFSSCSS